MNTPFLYHGQDCHWVIPSQDSLTVRVVTEAGFEPTAFYVRCEPDNEQKLIAMKEVKTDNAAASRLKTWQAELPLNRDKPTTVYCFKAVQGNLQWWLHGEGVSTGAGAGKAVPLQRRAPAARLGKTPDFLPDISGSFCQRQPIHQRERWRILFAGQ